MRVDRDEVDKHLDVEFWIEQEGLTYKMSRGSSGMQINLQECPSCHDRRWRTYVNAETGRGNCFKCNATFKGKLDLISTVTGLSWPDVYKQAAETMRAQGWRPKRTVAVAVEPTTVKMPLSMALPTTDGENLKYLEERGINGELAKYFGLRFCDIGWWNFKKEDGTPSGQNFGNRVLIPVYDLDGTFVTFQGRDLTGESEQKYLFPKMLPGTGRYLLNGQNAIGAKRVSMGEGFFDVAAIKRAFDEDVGLRDVVPVGSFGKHLSYGTMDGNDQLGRFLELKRSGLREVTIMWDGEAAALSSALDAGDLLHRAGLSARIALLPKDKDPNEVAPDVVRQAFYGAMTYDRFTAGKLRMRNPYKA